jgi:aspartyl-tRNA(Asn)/glutamyl-tRNA(Gln) amidotransferase subunit B
MGELSAALNRDELSASDCPLPAATLGRLIQRIQDGTISGKIAKELFEKLWNAGRTGNVPDVDATIEAEGMTQVSDTAEIAAIIDGIVEANPAQVEQFKAGKEKVLGFFVGQVMKATQGKANPQVVNELLREALSR